MSCSSADPPAYCSAASPELKLYQAFIFSVPVFFTFVLLLLFYVFYLRRRRANWQSLRMRAGRVDLPRPSESGIKKEVREMLPVVVFRESFLVRETQCAVCLGDYKSDDRLQRIPPCGHTFHVDCIDHWLATNTTCPLCRVSLLPVAKAATNSINYEDRANQGEEAGEQSSVRHPDGMATQHENVAEERERVSGNEELGYVGAVQRFRHDDEGSVVINIEASDSAETNQRVQ